MHHFTTTPNNILFHNHNGRGQATQLLEANSSVHCPLKSSTFAAGPQYLSSESPERLKVPQKSVEPASYPSVRKVARGKKQRSGSTFLPRRT
jgi:hypothetical protein